MSNLFINRCKHICRNGFFYRFIIAVKSGQYDDDYTLRSELLFDDEIKLKLKKEIKTIEEKQI
jgi:nitrogen fixation-related uncharacterized protein